jgi:glycosyltransferase involved in cell wall biosynthesis
MINGKTITIVVPCKNESSIIQGFIQRVPSYVDEILIVDNNSTDATAKIAKKAGARVVAERREIGGIGYGFAHQTGIEKATGDWVVAMDGDDTYPVKRISTIIRKMEQEHIDFISCNRMPLRNKQAISKTRQFGIKVLNTIVWVCFGYPIQDILSGMWISKRSTLKSLRVTSGDWNFSPEVKLNAIASKTVVFGEYHIDHFARAKEPSKQQIWKTGIGHMRFILFKRLEDIGTTIRTFRLRVSPVPKESYAK